MRTIIAILLAATCSAASAQDYYGPRWRISETTYRDGSVTLHQQRISDGWIRSSRCTPVYQSPRLYERYPRIEPWNVSPGRPHMWLDSQR